MNKYVVDKKGNFMNYVPVDYKCFNPVKRKFKIITKGVCLTILAEFKTPYTRRLTNKLTEKNYIRQVLIGVDIIATSSIGVFIETSIEVCNINQLDFTFTFLSTKKASSYSEYDEKNSDFDKAFSSDYIEASLEACEKTTPYRDVIMIGMKIYLMNNIDIDSEPFLINKCDIKNIINNIDIYKCNIDLPVFVRTQINDETKRILEYEDIHIDDDYLIYLDDFGFIESITPHIKHDDLTKIISIMNMYDISHTKENIIDVTIIQIFYESLLEILRPYINGYSPWKLLGVGIYLLPHIDNITAKWEDQCREIIDTVTILDEKLNKDIITGGDDVQQNISKAEMSKYIKENFKFMTD